MGQRYLARTQYKQFISGRGSVKGDLQHTDLLCFHVVHYFLKQLLTSELFVSYERKVELTFLSDKIQQIAQNAANGSGLVAIHNSFTSDCSRGLHEIYRVVTVLTKT